MSRVGNSPIKIPYGVTVLIDNTIVKVKGVLGELEQQFGNGISLKNEDGFLILSRSNDSKEQKSKHGLFRSLLNNMVEGVSKGFTKKLELVGVGYRASSKGQQLDLSLGFSHSIVLNLATEIKVETISEKGKNPVIKLTSFDKQLLGEVVAKIRSFRNLEPYKGKGVKFVGEQIRRKAGKSA